MSKLHLVTIGQPKLDYARAGWEEYVGRLQRFYQMQVSHLADKWQHDAKHILETAKPAGSNSYLVVLVISGGQQLSSEQLAAFLQARKVDGREVCCVIGGPEGLPAEVIKQADFRWSFSDLTFPHDLAMVILAESLYRASSINAGLPYHRGQD